MRKHIVFFTGIFAILGTGSLSSDCHCPERNLRMFSDRYVKVHVITDISYAGNLIRIEDGTHFETSYEGSPYALDWREGDRITIGLNTDWFSFGFPYYLRNITNGSKITANLKYGPSIGNPYAKRIAGKGVDISENGHRITEALMLDDGSYFSIQPKDRYRVSAWKDFQYILIGETDDSRYPYLLINVNRDEHVAADLLGNSSCNNFSLRE